MRVMFTAIPTVMMPGRGKTGRRAGEGAGTAAMAALCMLSVGGDGEGDAE